MESSYSFLTTQRVREWFARVCKVENSVIVVALVALALSVPGAASALEVSPVQKVIAMLSEMRAKGAQEKEVEES